MNHPRRREIISRPEWGNVWWISLSSSTLRLTSSCISYGDESTFEIESANQCEHAERHELANCHQKSLLFLHPRQLGQPERAAGDNNAAQNLGHLIVQREETLSQCKRTDSLHSVRDCRRPRCAIHSPSRNHREIQSQIHAERHQADDEDGRSTFCLQNRKIEERE